MNPYDRYCTENDAKPRKGEYMDIGITITHDTPLARFDYALASGLDFLDFISENYQYCIDKFVESTLDDYNEFLGDRNRA